MAWLCAAATTTFMHFLLSQSGEVATSLLCGCSICDVGGGGATHAGVLQLPQPGCGHARHGLPFLGLHPAQLVLVLLNASVPHLTCAPEIISREAPSCSIDARLVMAAKNQMTFSPVPQHMTCVGLFDESSWFISPRPYLALLTLVLGLCPALLCLAISYSREHCITGSDWCNSQSFH